MMQLNTPVDLSPWFLTLEDFDKVIDWKDLFGNDHPVDLDIGCGRGLFVVNASQNNPDVNYLGIEIDYRDGRHGAARLKKRETPNARIFGGDILVAFDKFIADASVDVIRVYFPDPWWKRRHHSRRLFTESFAATVAKKLKPGGYLHHWTDVEEYFNRVIAIMDPHPQFIKLEAPEERIPQHDMDYETSFERKKRQAGETIYRALWQLKSSES